MNAEGNADLPADHARRMDRVRTALEGLSVGDALGECFFCPRPRTAIEQRRLPPGPWQYTDDTAMAISICEILDQCGRIDQGLLAEWFAHRYRLEPGRGYGAMAHRILWAIGAGVAWQEASSAAFDGQGSMGNGGSMRVAPVGAYFAEDLEAAAENARASAEVTHAHSEGQAGAIAVAVAAAEAWRLGRAGDGRRRTGILEAAIERTPEGATRDGLVQARQLSLREPVETAARTLGNGSRVVSYDTVPFAVWCAARHLDNYEEAFWATVSGLGDRDTTCAIVGGIVALAVGREGIPGAWIRTREHLPW